MLCYRHQCDEGRVTLIVTVAEIIAAILLATAGLTYSCCHSRVPD